jgi:hypothetical protein
MPLRSWTPRSLKATPELATTLRTLGDEYLVAACLRHHSRGYVDRDSSQRAVLLKHLSDVDAGAHDDAKGARVCKRTARSGAGVEPTQPWATRPHRF